VSTKDKHLAEQDQAIGLYMASLLGDDSNATLPIDAHAAVKEVDGRAVPHWAQHPFTAHLLHAGPLALALVRSAVTAMVPVQELSSARKDDPPWMFGAVEVDGHRVPCVDTLAIVTRMQHHQTDTQQGTVVVMQGNEWALLCARLSEVRVEPMSMVWRGPRGQRPWLAGVSRDQQFVLLDAGGLSDYLVTMRS